MAQLNHFGGIAISRIEPNSAYHRHTVERFMAKVSKTDECWLWIGYKLPNGYGRFGMGRGHSPTVMLAHRAAYIIFVGDIPPVLFVCHKCDVPNCVNPKHLFIGTAVDNMQDCRQKGRWKPATKGAHPGETHHFAKLTAVQVKEIRRLLSRGLTCMTIAARFSVTSQSIGKIKRNERWKSVA